MGQNVNIVDPLYESFLLPIGGILEHQYVTRAMGVGLSAIPPQWVRGEYFDGKCDPSQFEHGCGVAHLAQIIAARHKTQALDFVLAAFLHDISQPAFSHIGERQLKGYDPHARAAQMVREHSLAAFIRQAGVEPDAVAAIIRGEGPYAPLLSGPLDLDHLDGTLRYATRYGVFQQKPYNALEIADAFRRTPRGWVLEASVVPHLERWRFVMERNCRLAYGVRCLGRVALLQKAFEAYQAEKGDIARLLSGTDWNAVDRMRQAPSSAMYINMLDRNAPIYHLGDVEAPVPDIHALRRRVASQVKATPDCILAEGARTARTDTIILPLSNGKTFEATTVIPALVRVYSIEPPPRKPDPQAWCATQ